MSVLLKGITWSHSRGYTSITAVSQRFSELNPGVSIEWEKRSLQEFADAPIENLAKAYDLLIIDHPWAGFAAATGILLPLNEYLPAAYLADQEANSVGNPTSATISTASRAPWPSTRLRPSPSTARITSRTAA